MNRAAIKMNERVTVELDVETLGICHGVASLGCMNTSGADHPVMLHDSFFNIIFEEHYLYKNTSP